MPRLTPRQRSFIRRKSRAPDVDPSQEGELNIVPFLDIVMNLIMFLLLTTTVALSGHEVSAQLPTHGPPGPASWRATVVIAASGDIIVSDSSGVFAPGCRTATSEAATVPTLGGAPDWLGLRSCALSLHAAHPDTSTVTLAADPTVALADIIHAMDALRGSDNNPVFSDIQIAAGIR